MLLAGGKGTRLGILTHDLAKPSVPFGGEYRLIDFPLSNCSNSRIDTVGVVTQYQPLVLHSILSVGRSWDLDRRNGGLTVLPPYVREDTTEWYRGTADAVYRNTDFIELYDPEYVLILSADHVYKMDYRKMLDQHRKKDAEASIAVIEVPWKKASRLGIMDVDTEMRIKNFVEKPDEPPSNLASMGIYIFNWDVLRDYLKEDSRDPTSDHDFGKDIIPKMLQEGIRLFAYPHQGYWMDVGTIDSYWSAHMDLLQEDPELDLYDRSWVIYSTDPHSPPLYVAPSATISRSLINKGARIFGEVSNSVIFYGVRVDEGASIKNSVIMPGVRIESGCVVENAIICEETRIAANCRIGVGGSDASSASEVTVIGRNLNIKEASIIDRGEVVG